MKVVVQDAIEREVFIRAPRTRVFQAITDPSELVQWFPDAVQGELVPGQSPIFDFGKGHRCSVLVVSMEPDSYFAYRWVPNGVGENGWVGDVLSTTNTLVEFILEEVAEGTRVVLRESGFAALLSPNAAAIHADHSEGWTYFANKLGEFLESA